MKALLTTVLALWFLSPATAQKKGIFLRVYNHVNTKIYTGHLAQLTDSTLVLEEGADKTTVPITAIGSIRLKHSTGHKMVIAGTVTAVTLAIIGGISGTPKKNDGTLVGAFSDAFSVTPGEGILAGFVGGAAAGVAVGGIIGAVQKKQILVIDNDKNKWMVAKETLKPYLPRGE